MNFSECQEVKKGFVHIEKQGERFTLIRDGQPYYIQGVGGNARLEVAKECGANSFRTWGSFNAGAILDGAKNYGMTVMQGIGMPKNIDNYSDEDFKKKKREEVQGLLDHYKNHEALLIWAIGNEINLGTNEPAAWEFVGELAHMIKSQDPNHPVSTVIAGADIKVLDHIAQYAPDIDMIGINSYAGQLHHIRDNCINTQFKGPYAITEWGPRGFWEIECTQWDAPIEQLSSEKAVSYLKGYEFIKQNSDIFLGSYVFLWGQKEERTPTWFGVFVETNEDLGLNAESCPTVDVMHYGFKGTWPENQAPEMKAIRINGKKPIENVVLQEGQECEGSTEVTDPDGDPLTYVWEILHEATVLGFGGSYKPRPERWGEVIKSTEPTIQFKAPTAGKYRLYVYALDGKGHVATANIPFLVQ